jgi:hypothetical protein
VLSPLEARLRSLAKDCLSQTINEKATYWRQRAKIKNIKLEDENSRYFHLCASGRLRKNQIKALDSDLGDLVFFHPAKATILHDFFKQLLSTPLPALDLLDLPQLVASTSLDST